MSQAESKQTNPPQEEIKKVTPVIPPVAKEPSKPKSTPSLFNIGKPKVEEKKQEEKKVAVITEDKPIDQEVLKRVWFEFAELRKNQLAEYQLLKRGFEWVDNKIVVTLSNPIEEPFLQGVRTSLIAYLRDKLSNSSLLVVGILKEIDSNRPMIYTNQEKFTYLVDNNPLVKEMKDRFGLDAD